MRLSVAKAALLCLSVAAVPAMAGPVSIGSDGAGSTEGYGSFTGTMTYVATSSTKATLTVSITNTSPAANGGYITAIAFNNPGDKISGVTLSSNLSGFSNVIGGSSYNGGISGPPFGNFDIGASTSSSWLGGGSPTGGVAVGQTANLVFSLTGTGLNTLTEQSFLNACVDDEFMIVRFRGFNNGGSDKVPTDVVNNPPPPPPVSPVPEPTSIAVFAIGFGALFARRHFRRK